MALYNSILIASLAPKKNLPSRRCFEIRALKIKNLFWFLFFIALFSAEEKPLSLTYNYTILSHPKKKWTQEIKEYHTFQKHAIEQNGNLSILHQEDQKLIWYFSKTKKRAEKSFDEQIQTYQKWQILQDQEVKSWKQALKSPNLHATERQKLQEQIQIATLSYQLTQIREEKVLNQDCWLYEISWNNQVMGQVWISKTLQWSSPVPFTLLEGPWDRLAQIKEKLPGPIVKLQMPLSPLEKYPFLEIELRTTLLSQISEEKFDPN